MRKDLIIDWLAKRGQSLTDNQISQMARYQEMVLSAPMNLTAIKSNEDFAIKHFIDSLTLLPWLSALTENASCIDIGTGAGFPGVPIKIARPGLCITLLDSILKRILFLRSAIDELGLQGIQCIHARAEDFAKQSGVIYDVAVARAVARLSRLVEYSLPLVKTGGLFLAMKGPNTYEEIQDAKPALRKYGGVIESLETVDISQEIRHAIIVVKKTLI